MKAASALTWPILPRRHPQRHPRIGIDVVNTTNAARLALLAVSLLCMFADQTATVGFGTVTPYVRGAIAADPDEAAWISVLGGAGYMLAVVLSPRFFERLGRRRTFLMSASAFTLFTLLCAWSPDYNVFLAVHTFAQLFEGLTYASAVVLMCVLFPRATWGYAFITFALSALVGQYLATLIAGLCVDETSSAVFFVITAFVVGAGTGVAALTLPKDGATRKVRFDTTGIAIFAVAALAAQYLAVQGERYAWFEEPHIELVAIAFGAALAGFAFWMFRGTRHPLFDWRVVLSRNHIIGDVISLLNGFFGYASTVFALYLETALEFTPTLAGEMLAFRLLVLVVTVVAVGFLHAKRILDNRISLTLGFLATAVAFWRLSLEMTATADFTTFLFDSALLSFGLGILTLTGPGLVFGPLTNVRVASGVVFYKLTGVTGGLIGAALITTFFDHRVAEWTSEIASSVTLSSPAVAQLVANHAAKSLAGLVAVQARTGAYADTIRVFAVVALFALPLVAAVRPAFPARISPEKFLQLFKRRHEVQLAPVNATSDVVTIPREIPHQANEKPELVRLR